MVLFNMKMKTKLPIKPFDLIIIPLALALTGFSAYSIYVIPRDISQVLIQGSGHSWVFSLEAEETIAVPGPLGDTVIRIHNNQTWVVSSPCNNQICVAAGKLQGHWGFAACLPNNVLLMIEGADEQRLDARTW